MAWVFAVLGTCLAVAGPAGLVQRQGPASLHWHAPEVSGHLQLPFTAPLTITMTVATTDPVEVVWPASLIRTPGWRESKRRAATQSDMGWSQSVDLEPLTPGEFLLQIEGWRYRIAKGDWQTPSWGPVAVKVTSRGIDPTETPRDITAIETGSNLPQVGRSWWWLGLGGSAVVLLVMGILWRKRFRSLGRDPRRRALQELDRLDAKRLLAANQRERHFTLLANVLRRYLEKSHVAPARRQTTAEFLAQARANPALAADLAFLEAFLPACDEAKFAPPATASTDGDALATQLRTWLEARRPAEQ